MGLIDLIEWREILEGFWRGNWMKPLVEVGIAHWYLYKGGEAFAEPEGS